MMTKHMAVSLRPGSKFQAWDRRWKVTNNDTLNRVLQLKEVKGSQTKKVRYTPTTQITCYWVPFSQS